MILGKAVPMVVWLSAEKSIEAIMALMMIPPPIPCRARAAMS